LTAIELPLSSSISVPGSATFWIAYTAVTWLAWLAAEAREPSWAHCGLVWSTLAKAMPDATSISPPAPASTPADRAVTDGRSLRCFPSGWAGSW
jgi:hypothetical protein